MLSAPPSHPQIIQGGMGAAVSGWRLARAVSALGQLGVVSGTALEVVLARRLQDGDLGGHLRRALDRFPFPAMVRRIRDAYFIEGGKRADQPYKAVPLRRHPGAQDLQELCVVANFVEVNLAREGHDHPVGINYLEKIQLPHLPSLYGAMLAGVTYVLMGAGIPSRIPGVLDRFVHHEPATYPLYVAGAGAAGEVVESFDPRAFGAGDLPALRRPYFLPIVASNALATTLARKSNGRVDGFVIEGPTAGGHNAPPRGRPQLSGAGEPVYGERDRVDLEQMRALGLPFWMAGGCASAASLRDALAMGGAGIQVGTAFALCEESGLHESWRAALLAAVRSGMARVFTDPVASPTGFPFKVAQVAGTLSERGLYDGRVRICDLGFLREAYRKADGTLGYRCPAEPVEAYVAKGGRAEDTVGRKCVCNGLIATVGHPQVRPDGTVELPLITAGDDLPHLGRFHVPGRRSYTAKDVVDVLLAPAGG